MTPNELDKLLIDRPQDGLFEVNRRLFTDDELFEMEMKYIFERTWIYLCHESQVADPHDHFATHIGRQPVVVSRDGDGKLHCFVNACAHRGATLCRTAKSNSKFLTCPYHGWVYDSAGQNMQIKDHDSGAYPPAFEQQDHNLRHIARLESYKGFVFGSLSAEVPPLQEHLADAKPFVDMLDAMSAQGAEVIKGSSTYRYRGNWKMQAENGIDGYHFTTIHANYVGVITRRMKAVSAGHDDKVKVAFDDTMMKGFSSGCYDLQRGHALIWIDFPLPQNRPLWQQKDEVEQRVGGATAEWMLKRQRNLLIYPNVQLMEQASSQIRVFRPISADLTEVKIYCIAAKGESASMRERRIRQYEDFFNATGMATPDDLAVFEACQAGYAARLVEWQQGYDRGMTHMTHGPDKFAKELGINPNSSGPNATDETLYHGQYREWMRLMQEGLSQDRAAGREPLPRAASA
ncbi:MAG: Rieske 2Fe-2S domain-containing protein [Immundisolibacter sp.]|uniref:Rieske 2Fe-2S domain-containing protein n=1 Tax=Immundisolibacter sp. TaxID=1934948 RepID=UPI003EE3076A